jgi:hypothetical protein
MSTESKGRLSRWLWRQMAWKPLSVRTALSIRPAGELGRRIQRSVHSLGLDEPRPLRSPMASTHGNLVLPLSRLVAGRGIEDHRSRRAIAPLVASPLSSSALAGSPPEASSPRYSPHAYSASCCAPRHGLPPVSRCAPPASRCGRPCAKPPSIDPFQNVVPRRRCGANRHCRSIT